MTVVMAIEAHYRSWPQIGGGFTRVILARRVAVPEPYQAGDAPDHPVYEERGLNRVAWFNRAPTSE